MTDSARSYDDTPYPSLAYAQSHPDRLATVAALFGLAAAPVTACRVLEIGCASGGNLLPMAATLPGSQFTGLDISSVQIAAARECAEGLPLVNVTFEAGSLADFQAEDGSYDYIIAHGVYSWLEAPLREKLLALCGRLLSARGVAYVSYNTYPGSSLRQAMRHLIGLRTCGEPAPGGQLMAARKVFELIGSAMEGRADPYAQLVHEEIAELRKVDDSYIAHEHLESTSEPCYFHEFAAAAAGHGLQYLGEAEVQTMGNAGLPPAAAQALRGMARDLIEAEQFLDFARNRPFRQTLLCRAEVPLKRSIAPGAMEAFYVASAAKSVAVPAGQAAQFKGSNGEVWRVNDPLTAAAMSELADRWPIPVPFPELAERAAGRAAGRAGLLLDEGSRRNLALQLLGIHAGSVSVELSLQTPAFQTRVSDRPEALDLARWQAQRGVQVVNGRHENLELGASGRELLVLLDGTRTVEEIAAGSKDARAILEWFGAVGLLKS